MAILGLGHLPQDIGLPIGSRRITALYIPLFATEVQLYKTERKLQN
jgi:hypothetical protein